MWSTNYHLDRGDLQELAQRKFSSESCPRKHVSEAIENSGREKSKKNGEREYRQAALCDEKTSPPNQFQKQWKTLSHFANYVQWKRKWSKCQDIYRIPGTRRTQKTPLRKKKNNKSQFHIRRNFWTAWKAAEEISLHIPNSAQFWLLDKSHKQAG